jgi:hypothetical protein
LVHLPLPQFALLPTWPLPFGRPTWMMLPASLNLAVRPVA